MQDEKVLIYSNEETIHLIRKKWPSTKICEVDKGIISKFKGAIAATKSQHVFAEIVELPEDNKRLFFADDNTFFDVKRAQELYYLIKSNAIRKKYSGYCRSDTIVNHPELIKMWREIGLYNLAVGLESVSDDGLRKFNKKSCVEINQKAINILNQLKIHCSGYFMINPDFDTHDFEQIVDYPVL